MEDDAADFRAHLRLIYDTWLWRPAWLFAKQLPRDHLATTTEVEGAIRAREINQQSLFLYANVEFRCTLHVGLFRRISRALCITRSGVCLTYAL